MSCMMQTFFFFLRIKNASFSLNVPQKEVLCLLCNAPKIYHINSLQRDPLAEVGFKQAGFQTACQGKVGGAAPQESS